MSWDDNQRAKARAEGRWEPDEAYWERKQYAFLIHAYNHACKGNWSRARRSLAHVSSKSRYHSFAVRFAVRVSRGLDPLPRLPDPPPGDAPELPALEVPLQLTRGVVTERPAASDTYADEPLDPKAYAGPAEHIPDGPYAECPACRGAGSIRAADDCPACQGRGWVND